MCLVESVPILKIKHRHAIMHSIRIRLEESWRRRLGAELNKKINVRATFSGWSAARGEPELDA